MQTAGQPSRSEWRPVNIPKLSYRNSAQIDLSQLSPREPPVTEPGSPAIPESTPTWPTSPSPGQSGPAFAPSQTSEPTPARLPTASPQNQKRKSRFGGLFAKEPTSVALEKVAAQLIAQHGELSPRAVPGVSSQKLPDFVPKVNSKWDGVPEALKERDKAEKDRSRQSKRSSMAPTMRSRSAGGSRDSRRYQSDQPSRERRNSNSTMSSFDSRGRAAYQHLSQTGSSEDPRTSSQASSSHNAGNQRPQEAVSTKSQSLRSPSGMSLPEITAFFPNDIPAPPALPAKYRSEPSTYTMKSQQTFSIDRTRGDQNATLIDPQIDAVPEYTSSPITTPREGSPVTPSIQTSNQSSGELSDVPTTKGREDAVFLSSGADVLGPPATATLRRKPNAPRAGFLAGEARLLELPDDEPEPAILEPAADLTIRQRRHKAFRKSATPTLSATARVQQDLENRPDSSRARLGLRASMIVDVDQTPWAWHGGEPPDTGSPSPRQSMPAGQKKILGLGVFGKDKERK